MIDVIMAGCLTKTKMIAYMQNEKNAGLRQQIVTEANHRVCPMLEEVIRTGNASGEFKVSHPAEMAASLLGSLTHHLKNVTLAKEPSRRQRTRVTLEEVFTRSLLAKEGSIRFKW